MTSYQSILITGASSGLGAALAHYYAAPGVFLALSGRQSERLEAVAKECRNKGAKVETALIDVTDSSAMKNWIETTNREHTLDLVIANAGISGGTGGTDHYCEPDSQVQQIMDINVNGVLNTIGPALSAMIERNSGHIAIMSSLAGFFGWSGAAAYSASKAAVRIYGESLVNSLYDTGVSVSVICPGFIRTPMTDVNNYYMPFLISAEKASLIIANGLKKKKTRIAFPLRTYGMIRLFGLVPLRWGSFLLSKLPTKPAMSDS